MNACGRPLPMQSLPGLAAGFVVALVLVEALERPPEVFAEPAPASPGRHPDREAVPLPERALTRVGSVRLRTVGGAYHLEYSPDGSLLASLGFRALQVWDARTGNLVRFIKLPDLDFGTHSGCFSANSKSIVLLDWDSVRWFDVRSGEETKRVEVDLKNHYAVIAPRGEMAAREMNDGKDLVVFDLPSCKERFRKTSEAHFFEPLAFSPDGKTLAELESNNPTVSIHLLDTKTGEELGAFRISDGLTRPEVIFSPDSKKLLVWHSENAYDHTIDNCYVLGVPSGELLKRIEKPTGHFTRASFMPDGRLLFVGMNERECNAVRLDPVTGKELRRFRLGFDASFIKVESIAFTPDGNGLAVSHYPYISQWDLAAGNRRTASAEIGNQPHRFSDDGKLLWVEREGLLALVDWQSGRELRRVPREGQSAFLVLSPDGSRIAGTNSAGKLTIWDAESGAEIRVFGVTIPLSSLSNYSGLRKNEATSEKELLALPIFSADGKKLYVLESEKTVRILDLNSGKEVSIYVAGSTAMDHIIASPDGRHFAASVPGEPKDEGEPRDEVLVWDLAGRREVRRVVSPVGSFDMSPMAFSPDGRLLALMNNSCASRWVTVQDVRAGKERFSVPESEGKPEATTFSPDGRLLAIGDGAGAVHLLEVATGQERLSFVPHGTTRERLNSVAYEMAIDRVVFSPDGRLLATSSHTDACLVWDVEGRYGKAPSATPFSDKEATKLWNSLNETNAAAAFEAMQELLSRTEPAVALLCDRLRPASAIDEKVLRRLLRDLDAGAFAVREKASAALKADADRVAPMLREALTDKPSAEMRRRLQRILEAADHADWERRRELRAVEVLERLSTAGARELLRTRANGSDGAYLTREARAAVKRLERRMEKGTH